MKTIIEIITEFCKNYGSYIEQCVLKNKWLRINHRPEAEFRSEFQIRKSASEIVTEGDRVYLSRVYQQEEYAALRLHELRSSCSLPPIELPPEIRSGNITLTAEQRSAVQTCLNSPLSLLLAPAGSGKTTVLKAIVEYAGTYDCLLCSPTGKAAKNITDHTDLPAATIHRALGVPNTNGFLRVERDHDLELIIVDEATMMTLDMLGGILRAAPANCRIVLIGDRRQLPAVGPGDVINDLVALGFPVASLTQNHRQRTDSSALRSNVLGFDSIWGRTSLKADDSFFFHYSDSADDLIEPLVQEAARRYRAGESTQVLCFPCDRVMDLNRRLQHILNPAHPGINTLQGKGFEFVDHDRVVIIENDHKRGCYNGDTGIIHINDDKSYAVELDDGRCPEWPETEAPSHILPAYAMTVHRAQGSAYNSVLMFVPRTSRLLLHRNSFYTGISRARDQLLLYGDPKAVSFALGNLPPKRNSALVEKTNLYRMASAG